MTAILKIGTRGSPLALYQARLVQSMLVKTSGRRQAEADIAFPILIYKTSGDRLTGALAEFGGKGLFTKELEDQLESGEIDLAVHSMKDVPTLLRDGHRIAAVLKREDPRDAFISKRYNSFADLPKGAVIGTASLRRRAQVLRARPDITFTLLRGNVGTRLKKLEAGACDATFLALAGLSRLGAMGAAAQIMESAVMLGAPAQGAIGIEIMSASKDAAKWVAALNHEQTQLCITAERAFLRALDGSCRVPIAALAEIKDGKLSMTAERLSDDGQTFKKANGFLHRPDIQACAQLGQIMGAHVKAGFDDAA